MSNSQAGNLAGQKTFFGHPVGLGNLFFTELWERFSYYGMRALLVLFMVAAVSEGGLGFDDPTATAIYGLYTAGVYLAALPGGWLADRIYGQQNAIWYGGIIIAAGHLVLALPGFGLIGEHYGFFMGLILIVVGTGLLKPNISSCVGELYPEGGARRDAGYVLYYMGINLGAFLGPLVCGFLRINMGWHWGFAAAAVGMIAGLIVYRLTQHHLGDFGKLPNPVKPGDEGKVKAVKLATYIGTGLIFLIAVLALEGVITIDALSLSQYSVFVIVAVAALFFGRVLIDKSLTGLERRRVVVLIALFIGAALFWSGFEQAGSSLNLFAERYTARELLGIAIPAEVFQSLNPLYILIFAPFFSALWINLGRRNLDPSIPLKFALGFLQLGIGFGFMWIAASLIQDGGQVLPTWLLLTYLFHTTGELCLSPIGLSATSKLAPRSYYSQMMGMWFFGAALGNLLAGLLAGEFSGENVAEFPERYRQIVIFCGAVTVAFLIATPFLKKMAALDQVKTDDVTREDEPGAYEAGGPTAKP
ncbi:peptide MFS transporter [Wenzhouxiangella marina]|uniref:Amino acid transporter n=1 Tax=Wenzhouxiangella marina TaxID=1579979 RepID=A0A0K0XVA7_9GAMM|nr:oligopeptide:H+ symporter [Wenzhouxiangella marina]AKS41613.1 amino acid transporter [Wenzhouxiangella marina]MBB6086628.1 POT family proton-dependent oligopeptide transporter [Wenzhouxiangella marina]